MKKKILFVIPEFAHGGTNKTLENYLSLIDSTKYDISIFCLNHIAWGQSCYYYNLFSPYLIRLNFLCYLVRRNRITRKILNFLFKKNFLDFSQYKKYEIATIQRKYTFDIVIAFQEESTTEYVSHFNSVKKIAWLHSFWAKINRKATLSESRKFYESYDAIVCVSKSLEHYFQECHPPLSSKTRCIYNPINSRFIRKLSEKPILDDYFQPNSFSIISVGHLNRIKNFHLIPIIAKEVKEQKTIIPFKWYIIGGEHHPGYKKEIIDLIKELHLEETVILLGEKDNPYPYIKASNLLVCTSESESFSYVIAEAKILHTPVLSNNFAVASDVVSSECGWICPIDCMSHKLVQLINDTDCIYSNVLKTINNYEYDNRIILKNLDGLFNT